MGPDASSEDSNATLGMLTNNKAAEAIWKRARDVLARFKGHLFLPRVQREMNAQIHRDTLAQAGRDVSEFPRPSSLEPGELVQWHPHAFTTGTEPCS